MKDGPAVNLSQTPRELLPGFYNAYGLGDDGGKSSAYVKIEFTKKFALYIPNYDARRKALFKHDVHHLVTGYPSTFKGETEISAWELGSGCRGYWAAFGLDLQGFMAGLLFNLPGVYRAFIRGRRTRNLYNDEWTEEKIMDSPVGELQKHLGLEQPGKAPGARFSDGVLFLLHLLPGLLYALLTLALFPFILLYTFYFKAIH